MNGVIRFDALDGDRGQVFLDGKLVDYVVSGETGINGHVNVASKDKDGLIIFNGDDVATERINGNVEVNLVIQ